MKKLFIMAAVAVTYYFAHRLDYVLEVNDINLTDTAYYLKQCGLRLVCATEKTDAVVYSADLTGPLALVMSRPATLPWSASTTLDTGWSVRSSLFTDDTAPVKSRRFIVP